MSFDEIAWHIPLIVEWIDIVIHRNEEFTIVAIGQVNPVTTYCIGSARYDPGIITQLLVNIDPSEMPNLERHAPVRIERRFWIIFDEIQDYRVLTDGKIIFPKEKEAFDTALSHGWNDNPKFSFRCHQCPDVKSGFSFKAISIASLGSCFRNVECAP